MSRRPSQCDQLVSILKDGRWHTSYELIRAVPCVLHSRISDLNNKHGYTVEHDGAGGGTQNHRYRLTGSPLSESSALDAEPVVDDSLNGRTNDPRNSLRAVDEQPAVQLSLGLAA